MAILVDDMADKGGTFAKTTTTAKEGGAREVMAVVTHGILNGDAINMLQESCLS
ncbi:Uu.00g032450.m01.CDS01 [Anthostomella pinea]|uniref:ribose-phosphate diphosphokinase n=1 Tax=Anthostomella pinea TaxID=933095 RepID=A0AAI8V964_9PEZI|nr:Uu.00g032450.m01.CDS01 [Anthostomella pinea]